VCSCAQVIFDLDKLIQSPQNCTHWSESGREAVPGRYFSRSDRKLISQTEPGKGDNHIMNSITDLKTITRSLILIALLLLCVGFLEKAHAVVPAPDGSYPGFNTAEGQNALLHLTTGTGNTAVGWFSLDSVTTGSFNTAVGAGTLVLNTGDQNTATGAAALLLNTTGSFNTASGAVALLNNTTGNFNTATGHAALESNTSGASDTAVGSNALLSNTIGSSNTANGYNALESNTTGSDNTAIGDSALVSNTTGAANTAIGENALQLNTAGNSNVANGLDALENNATGNGNVAIGLAALAGNTTGNDNIALGPNAGLSVTTANNVIAIGSGGANVTNSCFIGNIRGVQTVNAAIPVVIDTVGQLGTTSSSRRFKKEIKAMDKASEAILALKPVTFHYKSDNTNTPQFGLIAEEVAAVNPDLVVRAENGDVYTVRYDAVNAMLLNEFLKEHRKVEEHEATIAQQRKDFETTIGQLKGEMEDVVARLKEYDSKIQRVSNQVELSKGALEVVSKNP
jgi:hypothetical protein